MSLNNVEAGNNAPDIVNVIIEIPAHGDPVKYEVMKESGVLKVDRFLSTPMHYPCNYGYIPRTLSEDNDPIDILVVTPFPLIHGSVIEARPVGMLEMTDEAGKDTKIIAVPCKNLTPLYDDIVEYSDLPKTLLDSVEHFFQNYKALEKNKWVKIDKWLSAADAKHEIEKAQAAYIS
jgi:inorganic pyrophosphatase